MRVNAGKQPQIDQAHPQHERSRTKNASGGDLGLQDGCRYTGSVVMRWKPDHPVTIGPGKAKQTKPCGPLTSELNTTIDHNDVRLQPIGRVTTDTEFPGERQ